MREVTYELYTFDELSDKAKNNLYIKWLEGRDGYYECDDSYVSTLDDISAEFGFSMSSYTYGLDYGFTFALQARDVENINDPLRLTKWVINNWYDKIVRYKSLGGYKRSADGKLIPVFNDKRYKSKINREHYGYPITGMYYEDSFMRVLEDVISYRKQFNTIYDLFDACLVEFFRQWDADRDNEETFEYFCNMSDWDDYEFFEDGRIADGDEFDDDDTADIYNEKARTNDYGVSAIESINYCDDTMLINLKDCNDLDHTKMDDTVEFFKKLGVTVTGFAFADGDWVNITFEKGEN